MVLSIMRRHAKSWLIKVLIAIIAIVFIFYFGYSFTSDRTVKIAYVNDELITGMEYQKAYRDLRDALYRQYRDVWSDRLVKMFDLENQALENLILERLIGMEARSLGLDVTDDEVQRAIVRYPAFQVNGRFDIGRYRALLAQNRMEPEDFEAGIARELLADKLRQFVLGFVPATDAEARDYFKYMNEKIRISYVKFNPEDHTPPVDPAESEIEAYFLDNKENYRVPEKIRLAYIPVDPEDMLSQVEVPEQAVVHYFEYHRDTFVEPEQVKASHILFKLPASAGDDQDRRVREKAESVLKLARDGEDFAGLAVEYSEGPSGPDGGDLGYFTRGQMVEAFEEAAFALEQGEISDVVRTQFGYHIIKVEDINPRREKPLDEVREEIESILAEAAAMEFAREKGLSLMDQMPYHADLAEYAAQHGLASFETPLFAGNEPIPGVGGTGDLRQSLFSLETGDVSELLEVDGKYYIFQVKEKESSRLPSLQEVIDEVKPDVVMHLAAGRAREAAEDFLKEASANGGAWSGLAAGKGIEILETPFFTRVDPVEGIGRQPEFKDMVFALNEDNPFPPDVYESSEGVFVFRWEERSDFDQEAFEKEKELYRFQAMSVKHQAAFEGWLESLRRKAEVRVLRPLGRN